MLLSLDSIIKFFVRKKIPWEFYPWKFAPIMSFNNSEVRQAIKRMPKICHVHEFLYLIKAKITTILDLDYISKPCVIFMCFLIIL